MSAPVKSFLAVGAAFAAGIAVTAVFVGGRPERPPAQPGVQPGVQQSRTGSPPVAAQAPGAVGPAPDARQPGTAAKALADPWVDPVRQRVAGSSANPPLPPLVFHLDRKREPAKDGQVQDAHVTDEEAARQAAVAIPPPRRPSASELLARIEPHREPGAATDATDGHAASRSPVVAPAPKPQAPRQTASTLRRTAGPRPAASEPDQDDARLAATRQSRRVYVARRDDADVPPGYNPSRPAEALDRYERDVADRVTAPRRKITSAEAGGVLRWLDQP